LILLLIFSVVEVELVLLLLILLLIFSVENLGMQRLCLLFGLLLELLLGVQ